MPASDALSKGPKVHYRRYSLLGTVLAWGCGAAGLPSVLRTSDWQDVTCRVCMRTADWRRDSEKRSKT